MSQNPDIEKLEGIIKDLVNRIGKIEKKVDHLTEKDVSQHFHIEHLHLNHLENLMFRLDQLNIKELSGSLNLGNNFGVEKPELKTKSQQENPKEKKEEKIGEKIGHKKNLNSEKEQGNRQQEHPKDRRKQIKNYRETKTAVTPKPKEGKNEDEVKVNVNNTLPCSPRFYQSALCQRFA